MAVARRAVGQIGRWRGSLTARRPVILSLLFPPPSPPSLHTQGLVYLHSKNICHRDLKPANIFLAADGSAKLGDLNVSKLNKGDDLMSTKIGTPYYMAPEVWNGKKYGAACDIWSLGCVMYELAALQPPLPWDTLRL